MSAVLGYLIKENRLHPEDLENFRQKRYDAQKPVQDLLIEAGLVTEGEFFSFARKAYPFLRINLDQIEIDAELTKLIPQEQAMYHGVFPIKKEDETLLVAMSDPSDLMACDEIRFLTSLDIRPVLCTKSQVTNAINKFYRTDAPLGEILKDTLEDPRIELFEDKSLTQEEVADLAKSLTDDSSVIRLVNKILGDAITGRASDIHIEPQEKTVDIRYRIDGALREIIKIPRELHARLVARVKILSRLDIAEKRKVQEGRVKAILCKEKIDLRISIVPLFYGEKVVIRILDNGQTQFNLNTLGFECDDLELFQETLRKPQGVILVTGPTGSGKTTTLYAALQHIKNEAINIVTIEDPIEYLIPGINQVQLSHHKDVTFASSLKSILRQDPDVILVGEVRDPETAEAAFRASLTGHLVFSTLHTNNAVSSITRLMNIDVAPYLMASSLSMVIAQRLIRVICPHCRCADTPDSSLLAKMRPYLKTLKIPRFYKGKGCPHCNFTGFYGRTSVFEILKVTEVIQDLILRKAPEKIIFKKAREQGMRTMLESGITKVAAGVTTLEEVAKVTDIPEEKELLEKTIKEEKPSNIFPQQSFAASIFPPK